MTISYKNGVSIGEIIFYVPILVVAMVLTVRHGIRRSGGWLFLITFSLARIIGPCFQLATIHYPTSVDLYTGYAILQGIGLSPLMLTALGLLTRVITSISRHHSTFPKALHVKLTLHLLVLAALGLGVVGGIDSSKSLQSTGKFVPQEKTKISVALFIVAYVLIVLTTILTAINVSHADPGEKRLLLAVALSLPFFLVRVIYSSLSAFDSSDKTFNLTAGNVTVWLVMSVIMELIIVITYEVVGLTLHINGKVEGYERSTAPVGSPSPGYGNYPGQPQGQPGYGNYPGQPKGQQTYRGNEAPSTGRNILGWLGRRTIIGRLITGASKNNDVEMQQQPY